MNRYIFPAAIAVISHTAIAAPAPADSAIDHALKVEFDELAAKATAAIDTIAAMEQRAREDGQSLNPSLIAQRALVQATMDDAAEALRSDDPKALRDRLTRARGHIERLYRML